MVMDKLTEPDFIWIHTGFIGDLILLSAAIEALAVLMPRARQSLVTNKAGSAVYAEDSRLSSIATIDKKSRNMFQIRNTLNHLGEKGDQRVFIQVHKSIRSSLLLLGLKGRRITYNETPLANLSSDRVSRVAVLHEYQRVLLLLESLNYPREQLFSFKPKLQPVAVPSHDDLRILIDGSVPLIGIAPGSIWGTKRWPSEYYAHLVAGLLRASDAKIVLLGSSAEHDACSVIMNSREVQSFGASRIADLSGQTSIKDLRFIFPKLSLLIANDSGPLHFASAFDIPTIAIFGATVTALGFGPTATKSMVLENNGLSCRPCGAHGPKICPLGHFKCMRDLTFEVVWPDVLAFILGLPVKLSR